MTARRLAAVALVGSLAVAAGARAAHPIISEDPGTLGTGGVELEVGYGASRGEPGGGRGSQLAPQLAFGLTESLDVLVVPRYLWLRPADAAREQGIGDTSLDLKWRFLETETVQLALRAGVELPTGSLSRGLGGNGVGAHGLVALAVAIAPVQWLVNLGYAHTRVVGERKHVPFASTAVVVPAEGDLQAFVEVATQANSDPERSTWPAVARTGLIWQAASWLALDIGVEGRLNHAAPRSTWLAGATFRW